MDFKLDRLVLAMATHEGWKTPNQTTTPGGTISYRNHNPLNMRSSPFETGKQGGFSVFETDMEGFAAAKWDIIKKARGETSTKLGPDSTLKELIYVWDSGDPVAVRQKYLEHVLTMTGFSASMKLKELVN